MIATAISWGVRVGSHDPGVSTNALLAPIAPPVWPMKLLDDETPATCVGDGTTIHPQP